MGQIFIAALKEETPNLKDFHYSGVGKINATIKIMELISKFQPNEIINYKESNFLMLMESPLPSLQSLHF